MRFHKILALVLTLAVATSMIATAGIEMLLNGSLESNGGVGTDDFTSWTIFDAVCADPVESYGAPLGGSDGWLVQTGKPSPLNGLPVDPPTDGTFAAMTDQGAPGAHVLYQDFLVLAGGGEINCDIYINNRAGVFVVDPIGLSHCGPPNQHFRMDIMDPAFPPDDTGAGVLANVFITNPGDPAVSPYQTVLADLNPFAGQTVRVRFGEVDTNGIFNAGVDNCSAQGVIPVSLTAFEVE